MIPHMPLLKEAEASSIPMGPATVPGPEKQGTRYRFWSLGKGLTLLLQMSKWQE